MRIERSPAELLRGDIYGITAEEYSLGRTNVEVVARMIDSGIKIIQYREKEKKARQKYGECLKIRKMTREAGVTFIVNDHVDLALLVGADGVHLGQDDLPPQRVRELVGEKMFIGLSTHSPQQAKAAVSLGVDYIGVGPIFATKTKKDVCEPVGLEYLDYVVKNISLPFVAIGGIKEHNIAEVRSRGAKCIALVTEIVGSGDIGAKEEVAGGDAAFAALDAKYGSWADMTPDQRTAAAAEFRALRRKYPEPPARLPPPTGGRPRTGSRRPKRSVRSVPHRLGCRKNQWRTRRS